MDNRKKLVDDNQVNTNKSICLDSYQSPTPSITSNQVKKVKKSDCSVRDCSSAYKSPHSPSETWKSITKNMAASPVCPVPEAPTAGTDADIENGPTGRSLLSKFEQVNNSKIDLPVSSTSLNVDTDLETKSSKMISPTSVMDPPGISTPTKSHSSCSPPTTPDHVTPLVKAAKDIQPIDSKDTLPDFRLHPSLVKNLTQPQLNRISFYGGVIHDINKDASDMAANDTSKYEDTNGNSAIIDEEHWLINTIANRSKEETGGLSSKCPSSFSEAIGETDPDSSNPLSNLNSSRTQLWKPSRSWWEARSGKNPWIEPKSHNKRWRYLWPLIHYHKFLARCIKKLKRNGVEVRNSQKPVCVFLRDEVCAVSDHLAEVSKFTAEEWLEALSHFNGWTDNSPQYESTLRATVLRQKLRSLAELSDVDSPLLRDQIDEQFLKTMENNRINMESGSNYPSSVKKDKALLDTISESNTEQFARLNFGYNQHQYGYPLGIQYAMPNRNKFSSSKSKRRSSQSYQYANNINHPFGHATYPQDMNQAMFHQLSYGTVNQGVYPKPNMCGDVMPGQFFPPHQHQHNNMHNLHHYPHQYPHQVGGFQNHPPFASMHDPSNFLGDNLSWHDKAFQPPNIPPGPSYNVYGSPAGAAHPYHVQQPSPGGMNAQKVDFHHPMEIHQPSPAHDSRLSMQNNIQVPPSPYWGHLDPMAGIASPHSSSHPQAQEHDILVDTDPGIQTPNHNSKPLFVNPSLPYNYYQQGRGYVPPSPATQFLMTQTPQGSGYFNNSINMASHAAPSAFPFESPRPSKDSCSAETRVEETITVDSPQATKKASEEDMRDMNEIKQND